MKHRQIDLTLWRLDWKLRRRGLSGRRRRAIRRELREHLIAVADGIGVTAAIERLGNLDRLAGEYAEAEPALRSEPDVEAGLWWALGALLLVVLLNGRHITSLSSLKDHGDFDPWSFVLALPGGVDLVRLYGDVEQSVLLHVEIGQVAYIVFPLIAFVLGLRPWRLLGNRGVGRQQDPA